MADSQDRLSGRNGAIWRAYASGRTQEWIAEQHGISQSRVSQILDEVREVLPADARADWRVIALETLGHLHAEMLELVDAEAPPVFFEDTALTHDGEVVRDHSGRVAAVDRVLKVQDRAAKLLGLDAATKMEASVTVDTSAEVAALLERARSARGG